MTQRIEVKPSKHSILGASGAYRWIPCPGSIGLTKKVYGDGDFYSAPSYAAAEGTAAHMILSICLEESQDAWEYIGFIVEVGEFEFEVNEEMANGVQTCIDLVNELMIDHAADDAVLHIEYPMDSMLHEDAFGTADVFIKTSKRIIIIDFKYGRMIIEADSIQNKYYGYLAWETQGVDDEFEVQLWISQPRIPHSRGTNRDYKTNSNEVNEWFMNTVLPAMEETENPKAILNTGSWCQFCPVRKECPALKGETMDFNPELEPMHMTSIELGEMIMQIDRIKKFESALRDEAFKRARMGDKVTGLKLVRKKANRIFLEGAEAKAVTKFGKKHAFTTPVLKSPAQIEKLSGGKKFTDKWADKPSDVGLTLAPESDARKEVVVSGEEFFGDVE